MLNGVYSSVMLKERKQQLVFDGSKGDLNEVMRVFVRVYRLYYVRVRIIVIIL